MISEERLIQAYRKADSRGRRLIVAIAEREAQDWPQSRPCLSRVPNQNTKYEAKRKTTASPGRGCTSASFALTRAAHPSTHSPDSGFIYGLTHGKIRFIGKSTVSATRG